LNEESRNRPAFDPTELWRQWYEAGTKLWSDVLNAGKDSYVDPYRIYRRWFEAFEDAWGRMTGLSGESPFAAVTNNPFMALASPATARPDSSTSQAPEGKADPQQVAATMGAAEAQNLWKQWFDAAQDFWQRAARLGVATAELSPRWVETLEQIRNNFLSAEGYPTDPLQLATRWYGATSGPISEFVGELIEREEFLEPSSQFLKSYASFYKVFRRESEEYLKSLSIPVRSDITRVAELVVTLEDKVDRMDEAFEDFEYGYAKPATEESMNSLEERLTGLERSLERASRTAEDGSEDTKSRATPDAVSALEGRLDAVEGKIDRLLAALENAPENGGAAQDQSSGGVAGEQQESAPQEEDSGIRATAAARRKAEELGMDLSVAKGTGAGGQITLDDVRRANAQAKA
jgi:hypothetical protein